MTQVLMSSIDINREVDLLWHSEQTPEFEDTQLDWRCVYLVKTGKYYKIGITFDIESRLKHFKHASPYHTELIAVGIVPTAKVLEKFFHESFADQCIHGEWFKLSHEDVEYIVNLLAHEEAQCRRVCLV